MMEHLDSRLYRLRFVFVGLLMTASLVLLTLLLSAGTASASISGSGLSGGLDDSPNAVAGSLAAMADGLGRSLSSTDEAIQHSSKAVQTASARSSLFVTRGAVACAGFAVRGVGNTLAFMAYATGTSVVHTVRAVGSILGVVSNAPVVSAVIKPADNTAVPQIDTRAAATLTASRSNIPPMRTVSLTTPQAASAPQAAPAPQAVEAPQWPILGSITTEFGVPHWPFQPTHTGLDISDGQPWGVTPVKPFKPGRVVDVVHSYAGLGNHVVVDHGNGLTSVYGHMYATSVQEGQDVGKTTVLGYEGSTGASTGTHLHFEIRVNGLPVNPHQYLTGQP